jgi:hypothetical protein
MPDLMNSLTGSVVILGAILTTGNTTSAAGNSCYESLRATDSSAAMFVEPKSDVCRALEAELNARCGIEIPLTRFAPRLRSSHLTEPRWTDVPLFDQQGTPQERGFSLLTQLTRSRAMATYSRDRAPRASRDADAVTAAVQQARASGQWPILQHTSIDLVGAGQAEELYRLVLGGRNPHSLLDANSGKTEPQLFLARAMNAQYVDTATPPSPQWAGADVTNMRADVVVFDGVPYFLTWSGPTKVVVYASYSRANRARIPEELGKEERLILPVLKCMFELSAYESKPHATSTSSE